MFGIDLVLVFSNLKFKTMKNNIDYVPAVKNLLDSVFDTYLETGEVTDSVLKKKPISHDLLESDEDFLLKLYVAGYKKEDFTIKVENNQLTVAAASVTDSVEGYRTVRSTNIKGAINKTFKLNEKVLPEDISASYEQGVLTLKLPKSKAEVKRTIEIK